MGECGFESGFSDINFQLTTQRTSTGNTTKIDKMLATFFAREIEWH